MMSSSTKTKSQPVEPDAHRVVVALPRGERPHGDTVSSRIRERSWRRAACRVEVARVRVPGDEPAKSENSRRRSRDTNTASGAIPKGM